MRRKRRVRAVLICFVASLFLASASSSFAQTAPAPVPPSTNPPDWPPPVNDKMIIGHILFDQLEWRTNGPQNEFRWEGEGWIGTDMNKLWFKSEGFVQHGQASDGDQEVLYDRPIPYLRYFDAQAGVRYDLDSDP